MAKLIAIEKKVDKIDTFEARFQSIENQLGRKFPDPHAQVSCWLDEHVANCDNMSNSSHS